MGSFRLHIDIPLTLSEDEAVKLTNHIMEIIESGICKSVIVDGAMSKINYRLGHDDDRQKSNYLIKTDSGHVTNKKSVIALVDDGDTE